MTNTIRYKTMKKDKAIFTICHIETFFLPRWINYYSAFFENEDIYVLLHNDNTVLNNVNAVYISTSDLFDHKWLRNTVQNFQRKLLQSYECVVFAEIDEFIYSLNVPLDENINRFLSDESCQYQTVTGYDIIQDLDNEPSLSYELSEKIIKNRKYRVKRDLNIKHVSDKTLITKIPLKYSVGFHCLEDGDKMIKGPYNFQMVHLHKIDWEMTKARHIERLDMPLKKDDAGGIHNKKPLDMKYWLGKNNTKENWELIPEIVRERLADL